MKRGTYSVVEDIGELLGEKKQLEQRIAEHRSRIAEPLLRMPEDVPADAAAQRLRDTVLMVSHASCKQHMKPPFFDALRLAKQSVRKALIPSRSLSFLLIPQTDAKFATAPGLWLPEQRRAGLGNEVYRSGDAAVKGEFSSAPPQFEPPSPSRVRRWH